MVDIVKTEEEFIYILLHNKNYVNEFLDSNLVIEHFNEEYQFILNCIIDSYDLNVLLTREAFKEKIKIFTSPKDRIAQEMRFNTCYVSKTSFDNFPVLTNKIFDYNIDNSVNNGLKYFGDNFKKNKITAINNLVDRFQNILYSSTPIGEKLYYNDVRVLSKDNIQYIRDVRDGKIKEKERILTGIKEIDDTMVTGLERGTLTLFCSDVGHFKSSIMMNIGLNVWESGHNVLFIPLEMDKDQIWKRMISRDSRVPCELITKDIKGLTNANFEKIINLEKKWGERKSQFYLMQEPERTTVENIRRHIERHINIFKPELVVIDYVANLEAHTKRYGRNDLEIGDMLKQMRHMGKISGFAVISAAQLGREFLKKLRVAGANRDKTAVHSEDIRGSHEYSADADCIYAQMKSVSQPDELLDIFCVKTRSGKTTFLNGNIRATLEVKPEIYLIRSQSDDFGDVNDILDGIEDVEQNPGIINKQKLFNEDEEIENNDDDSSVANDSEDWWD